MKELFFTGFPGFIAERLVARIIEHNPDASFHFVVHPSMATKGKTIAASLSKKYKKASFNLHEGDITKEHLGIPRNEYDNLVNTVTDIFHLAAVYDLATPKEVAHAVNVTGTQKVLSFARDCKKLKKIVYYSTCYVAGKRTGRVLENDLEKGQQFKNHYESTKYQAEVDVRTAMGDLPIITIRPSIVVGDSKTGETPKFDGPYFMLRFLHVFEFLHDIIDIPYLGEMPAYFNVVPVDYVVNGTIALWEKEGNEGTTYALADPNPLRAEQLYSEMVKSYRGKTPSWTVPRGLLEFVLGVDMFRKGLAIPIEVLNYLSHPVEYDTANAVRDLEGSGVSCPPFASYAPTMVDYYFKHADNEEKRVVVN